MDTYLKSTNQASLENLRAFVTNMIGPVQGTKGAVTEDGNFPDKGDPAYWYACIRAPFPIPAFGDVQLCDEKEGVDVCGVWA